MRSRDAAHTSVLESEVLSCFQGIKLRTFFEATVGAGGHEPWREKVEFVQGNFAQLDIYLKERGRLCADGFFLISECHLCN